MPAQPLAFNLSLEDEVDGQTQSSPSNSTRDIDRIALYLTDYSISDETLDGIMCVFVELLKDLLVLISSPATITTPIGASSTAALTLCSRETTRRPYGSA